MTTDHKELIAELRKRSIHLMDSGGFGNAWFDTMKLIDKAADALEEAWQVDADLDSRLEDASKQGHYSAVRWVLGHLNLTGDRGSTTYEEILRGCGRKQIIQSAIDDDELEFTGLGEYVKKYGTRAERRLINSQKDR